MTMVYLVALVLGLVCLAVLSYFWLDFKGVFRSRTPENAWQPVGQPALDLQNCPHAAEGNHCGQKCLSRISAAPQDCLIRHVVTQWYAGKNCSECARPFAESDWREHPPCVKDPEGVTHEWKDVKPERVLGIVAGFEPVCWHCHTADTFRHEFPSLATDRDRPA